MRHRLGTHIRRSGISALRLACLAMLAAFGGDPFGSAAVSAASRPDLLLEGTIVTMNASRDVVDNGRVLVRNGRVVAVWRGVKPPDGVNTAGALRVDLGERAYIYPGLINLHDHPTFDALPLWQTPSSHQQASLGRPQGTEPYANSSQWTEVGGTSPLEFRRLVRSPQDILNFDITLDLHVDVVKFAETRMILGGTTTTEGAGPNSGYDTLLARNLEAVNFGRQRIFRRAAPLASATPLEVAQLNAAMSFGLVDAFLVHLAQGVVDSERRPGDTTSSRAEFADLKAKNLLTDVTVIVHGIALEPPDFADMAAAPAAFGGGDGLGAKLVWSPLCNLLLYGTTAAVYDAIAAGVRVSLGTDWTPSGSPNLLTELKIADIALRDERLLGSRRHLVPDVALDGHRGDARRQSEEALDRLLVEMVTINPAQAVRWDDQVGSIEAGKVADLLVITAPHLDRTDGIPSSPYRTLIDATEQHVRLVLVDGQPVAGDIDVMTELKPGDFEIVSSDRGCFEKAIDVTDPAVPGGTQTLSQISMRVRDGLRAMGGDFPPTGGGPSSAFTNIWSYLKASFDGTAELPDLTFNFGLASFFGFAPFPLVNLEGIELPPLFTVDNEWWFATLGVERDRETGLTDVTTPPYGRYLSNANQVTIDGNPFGAQSYEKRWYRTRSCGIH